MLLPGESVVAAARVQIKGDLQDLTTRAVDGTEALLPDNLVIACTQRRLLVFSTGTVIARHPRHLLATAALGDEIGPGRLLDTARAGRGKARLEVQVLGASLLLEGKRADLEAFPPALVAPPVPPPPPLAPHAPQVPAAPPATAAFGAPAVPAADGTPMQHAAPALVRDRPIARRLRRPMVAGAAMLGAGVVYAIAIGILPTFVIIDTILAVQLLRGRRSVVPFIVARAVLTIALLGWVATETAGDSRFQIGAIAATLAVVIVLVGQASTLRLAGGAAVFVLAAAVIGVTDAETDQVTELAVGECAGDPGLGGSTSMVQSTGIVESASCDEEHVIEIVAVLPVGGEAFPGMAELGDRAMQRCPEALTDYTSAPYGGSMLDIGFFVPDGVRWSSGSRTITCFGMRLDGKPLTSSLRDAGDQHPLPCFDDVGADTPCSGPHLEEMLSFMLHEASSDAEFPGVQDLHRWAEDTCTAAFAAVVGMDPVETEYDLLWLVPSIDEWRAGSRVGSCHVTGIDGALLEGSIRDPDA